MPAREPRPAAHFRLKLGGKESVGVFREASGFDSETEVIEQRSANERGIQVTRKVPGAVKWSDIVLKRGVDESLDLWKWRDTVIKQGADVARVDGTVELVDERGRRIATFQFRQGWPIKYSGVTLGGPAETVAVEEIVIAHEGFERI